MYRLLKLAQLYLPTIEANSEEKTACVNSPYPLTARDFFARKRFH